eukprot:m51a1_g5451 putative rna-binding protein pno1 (229) ;mRNA; f:210239-211144
MAEVQAADAAIIKAEDLEAPAPTPSSPKTDADKPSFPPMSGKDSGPVKKEGRKVAVPAHRYSALKQNWVDIFTPIVQNMKLQIRMNMHTRHVELQTSQYTEEIGALQKSADFVKAFILGFEVKDALALLRLDDIYVESFDVTDVRQLQGDHLSRAIGRIAGKDGRTKLLIENATRTRIVVADKKIHVLGSFANIKTARDAVCDLILGTPPGKVYAKLRTVAGRLKERW